MNLEELKTERALLLETTGGKTSNEGNSTSESTEDVGGEAGKVYIVPTLQMNLIKYREDEHAFLAMLKKLVTAEPQNRLKLATGYLNLQKEYIQEIVKAETPGKV